MVVKRERGDKWERRTFRERDSITWSHRATEHSREREKAEREKSERKKKKKRRFLKKTRNKETRRGPIAKYKERLRIGMASENEMKLWTWHNVCPDNWRYRVRILLHLLWNEMTDVKAMGQGKRRAIQKGGCTHIRLIDRNVITNEHSHLERERLK